MVGDSRRRIRKRRKKERRDGKRVSCGFKPKIGKVRIRLPPPDAISSTANAIDGATVTKKIRYDLPKESVTANSDSTSDEEMNASCTSFPGVANEYTSVSWHTIRDDNAISADVEAYRMFLSSLPRISARPGLVGMGLVVLEDVEAGAVIAQYAGEEVDKDLFHALPDTGNEYGAAMSTRNIVVDGAKQGNASRYINHCCTPNACLVERRIGGRTFLIIEALERIKAFKEVTMDYGECSEGTNEIIVCECAAPRGRCRGYVP